MYVHTIILPRPYSVSSNALILITSIELWVLGWSRSPSFSFEKYITFFSYRQFGTEERVYRHQLYKQIKSRRSCRASVVNSYSRLNGAFLSLLVGIRHFGLFNRPFGCLSHAELFSLPPKCGPTQSWGSQLCKSDRLQTRTYYSHRDFIHPWPYSAWARPIFKLWSTFMRPTAEILGEKVTFSDMPTGLPVWLAKSRSVWIREIKSSV